MSFIELRSVLLGRTARRSRFDGLTATELLRRLWLAVPVLPIPRIRIPAVRHSRFAQRVSGVVQLGQGAALLTLFLASGFAVGWLMAGV